MEDPIRDRARHDALRERDHGALRERDHGANPDDRNETATERADRNWSEMLQELRVTQTGTQIISGFLLAVAFQPRFTELDTYQLVLYLILVGLAATATVLGLAPVALHRTLFGRHQKQRVVRVGSRMLVADIVVIALLTAGVATLIFDFALGRTAGFITLAVGTIAIVLLWVVAPRMGTRQAGAHSRHEMSATR